MIDSVPLIQNANDAQQINASIIAMKKASRELDEKIVKLNSLNSELDKKIALLDSGLNKEIEDRKEAINSLDVSSVGGSGKYISAISETDGKISATASDITSSVSSGNSQPVTSGGVFNDSFLLREATDNDIDNYPIDGMRVYRVTGKNIGWLSNDGFIINIPWVNANYGAQIAVDDQSNWLAIRTKNQNTWGSWEKLINESDLTSSLANYLANVPHSNLTDCNTADSGLLCSNGVANTPNNTQGYVYVLTLSYNNDANYRVQVCYPISSTTIYIRYKSNGTWGNWETIVNAKTIAENYTPKSYQDRVTFTNNNSKLYKVGNHVKLHIDVTVTQVNVTAGKFAFNIIDLAPTSYPLAIYFMNGLSGIGLIDSSAISGLVWLKDSSGDELNCTSLLNKRIYAEIDFFV